MEKYGEQHISLKYQSGRSYSSFNKLAHLGSRHFKTLFKEDEGVFVDAIVQLALYFSRFMDKDYNRELMEEVTEE